MSWLAEDRTELAAERILDAAAELFSRDGIAGVGMDAVARAAGCSRATLYRYFDNRHALYVAFAHREAHVILGEVVERVARITDPEDRVVAAIASSLERVRARSYLLAWYGPAGQPLIAEILSESPLLESTVSRFAQTARGGAGGPDPDLGRWVLRAILSFLAVPGADAADEERLIRRFVAPFLLDLGPQTPKA